MRRFSLLLCLALVLSVAGTVFAAGEPVIVSKAGKVVVDGNLSDWAGAPAYYLSSAWTADAKDVAGDDDLSAFGMFSWDAGNLYMAFRVYDDQVVMEREGSNVWQTDCVEVWINGKQFGLTLANGAAPFVQDWGANGKDGVQVAVVAAAGGYIVEAAFPAAVVEKATGVKVAAGNSFPLAFGVDDADEKGGSRLGQIYFPSTWAHSNPSTFATATYQ